MLVRALWWLTRHPRIFRRVAGDVHTIILRQGVDHQ